MLLSLKARLTYSEDAELFFDEPSQLRPEAREIDAKIITAFKRSIACMGKALEVAEQTLAQCHQGIGTIKLKGKM